eukprot:COSAG05_NODE_2661_length_2791_cov_183.266716_2_plen_264_part_00
MDWDLAFQRVNASLLSVKTDDHHGQMTGLEEVDNQLQESLSLAWHVDAPMVHIQLDHDRPFPHDDSTTAVAPPPPPTVKYVCKLGKCVADPHGLPLSDCQQICISPDSPPSPLPPAPPTPLPPGPPGNLSYLSYYTLGPLNVSGYKPIHGDPYTIPGPQGTEAGANVAVIIRHTTGLSNLPMIQQLWNKHQLPSFYTPDGWMVKKNMSAPLQQGWQASLAKQASALQPLINTGAVRGVFYGDEIGCHDVPFCEYRYIVLFYIY